MIIGTKNTLAFVLGDKTNKEIQKVDVWIAAELITFIDNVVFLPQFIASLESELKDIKNESIDSDYIFLNLGPTLNDVSARIEIDDDQIFLKCYLYKSDGKILSAKISKYELIQTYQTCINELKK